MSEKDTFRSCLISEQVGSCIISLVLDKRHRKAEEKYILSLRFTIDRKRSYYPLGDMYSEKEFDAICCAQNTGRKPNAKDGKLSNIEIKNHLEATFRSYVQIVKDLDKKVKLNLSLITSSLTGKSDYTSFLSVWDMVINEKSYGTAESYASAKKSFLKSVGEISGFNISKHTIEKWIKVMESAKLSKTTIGIYLRACRVVWNECLNKGYIHKNEYPFGNNKKGLITIPQGSNRKKEYLTVSQMTELYSIFENKNYPSHWESDYSDKVHQSLGLFLAQYLCNGFNLSDAARLSYNDFYYISGKRSFQFVRHKTKDRNEEASEVIIPIIEPLKFILNEIAGPEERGALVFPQISNGEIEEIQIRKQIAQENSNIKDRVRKLVIEIGWEILPSSSWCRHSFATNLTHAGVPINYISDSMGHSHGERITSRYIDIFPHDTQVKYNNKLLSDNTDLNEINKVLETLNADELKELLTKIKKN